MQKECKINLTEVPFRCAAVNAPLCADRCWICFKEPFISADKPFSVFSFLWAAIGHWQTQYAAAKVLELAAMAPGRGFVQ